MLILAASLPTSGFAPAPSPVSPIGTFTVTGELFKALLSVFITAKVTLAIPSLNMLLTALHPPPPTPITFIMSFDLSSMGPKSIIGPISLL